MKITKIWLLSSVAFLCSCSVGPDYKRPQFFPNVDIASSLQISGQEQEISKEWYKQFNDPFLNTLIARGLQDSPTIEIAIQKLRQARQTFRINAVQNLPTLDANGSYNYSKDGINSGIPISPDYYQTGFDASWEIDIWGGGRRLTESSLAMFRAASSDLDNVKISLTAEIASNYYQLRQSQEQLRIAKKNLQLQQEIASLVKEKNKFGLADNIALNQAEYLVQTTQMQIPVLESEIEQLLNNISVLVGRLPGQLQDMLSSPDSNPVSDKFEYDLDKLYDLPISIIRNRPDIRVAENELIAQNAKIGQAIAKMFPNISVSGFLGWQSKHLSNIFNSHSDTYNYSPVISLPIFHWGALVNNVELQKSITEEQLQQYKSSILTAISEIRTAINDVKQEYKHNQSAYQAQIAQQQVSELTLIKYKQGLQEFSDVLTAEQNLLSAQKNSISSNTNIYLKLISFYKAVGGGYSTTKKDRSCNIG